MGNLKDLKLNKEQKEAIRTVKGNLLILASAGTGKTTTIVERYVNLVENHGIKPEEIMMTTFTNKAAKDMVSKIEKKTDKIPKYIGTMHSLFLRVLRDNHTKIPFRNNFTLLTEDKDKNKIIKQILLNRDMEPETKHINYFLKKIEKFKNNGVSEKELEEFPQTQGSGGMVEEEIEGGEFISINSEIKELTNHVYIKYQERLKKLNMMDFDDILLYTYHLFKNNDQLLKTYKRKLKSIMVDEAQDLNVVQRNILELIQNDNLCLIGDDCQNIYQWRGASNELIFNFDSKHRKITLKDNYRSSEKIINNINRIIDSVNFKIDKKLNCTKNKGNEITLKSYSDINEEIYSATHDIKDLIRKGESKDEIAVLFRTNRIGKQIERAFRKEKIPCHLSRSTSFFQREEVKDILSFLKLRVNPSGELEFERLLNLMKGIGKSKIHELKKSAGENNLPIGIILSEINSFNFNESVKETLAELNKILKDQNNNPIENFMRFFNYKRMVEEKYSKDSEKVEDKLENINVLREIYEDYDFSIQGTREFLDNLIELEKKEKDKNKVTLSTIHSAKGLEWKHVYLISCNETILPSYKESLSNIKKDDELRLFYVAVSRTKDFLTISHSENHNWVELEPSQFLDIIEYSEPSENEITDEDSYDEEEEECDKLDKKYGWKNNCFMTADKV